jgi:hypothetical protein
MDDKRQEATGRQDRLSPSVPTERSDPLPVDNARGQRLWLGFALVAMIMLVVLIYFWMTD